MHATHNTGAACPQPTRRLDGPPETEPDRRFFDLCESDDAAETYGQNELDHDRLPTRDGFIAWCAKQSAGSGGSTVTDAAVGAHTEPASTGEAPGTAAQVLRSAALYLERHGWIQGAYYEQTATCFTPAACLVGAIGMVCYGGPVDAPAQHFDDPGFDDFEEAVTHLDLYLLAEDGSESYEFNDARGRTADDVITLLRKAAATPADEVKDTLRAIHLDQEHQPGDRSDCPACEASCFCVPGFHCVRCFWATEEALDSLAGGDTA
jgi:hypothetical protein